LLRFFRDCPRRTLVQLNPNKVTDTSRFSGPLCRSTQQLSGTSANVNYRKLLKIEIFDFSQQSLAQSASVSEPIINASQLYQAAFVLLRRVVALIEVLKFITPLAESLKHKIGLEFRVSSFEFEMSCDRGLILGRNETGENWKPETRNLFSHSLYQQGAVLRAEANAVAKRNLHICRSGLVGNVIKIASGIRLIKIDRRRDHLFMHRA